ncbi:serine hydroxymethyltransferase [Gymnodinialimonas sp. 57CJ19]|uniref:serine hydroxymethyltransferase n=1 Tax=Gymnodinialimonas sp. 57CJ19 TaxID=3138498 RepID=UPI0031344676
MTQYFSAPIDQTDPLIADALKAELTRQQTQIELIASENIVSRAVLDALGHEMTNKTLEGYPGARFHGGGQNVDVVEQAAIDRACALFDCAYANVQPHSGSQANLAVFFALLKPGDRVLSLDLAAGGHLSHGLSANLSGRWFEAHHYGVDRGTGTINYDTVEARAQEVQPKLLIAGGSAYPRTLDFARLEQIAEKVGAYFMVDMAHIAGLVAGGVHPSPIPHADIVTCTTTKTLRGPRGGLILSRDEAWRKKLQSSVFPGVQGSLHTQVLAAKAVCLGEALDPSFKDYAARVVDNAAALSRALQAGGIDIVSGGTDTHIVLLDLSRHGILGREAEALLDQANITSNKNPVPYDVANPNKWVGLRLGVAAATTRGFSASDFDRLGTEIAAIVTADDGSRDQRLASARMMTAELCASYPIYGVEGR